MIPSSSDNLHSHQAPPSLQARQKSEALPSKASVFKSLESTERLRKVGRGIQIGATAVAVLAAAGGVVALHFTPVGWAILGAAALAVGVTTIAACVSMSRGGSFWNSLIETDVQDEIYTSRQELVKKFRDLVG